MILQNPRSAALNGLEPSESAKLPGLRDGPEQPTQTDRRGEDVLGHLFRFVPEVFSHQHLCVSDQDAQHVSDLVVVVAHAALLCLFRALLISSTSAAISKGLVT